MTNIPEGSGGRRGTKGVGQKKSAAVKGRLAGGGKFCKIIVLALALPKRSEE